MAQPLREMLYAIMLLDKICRKASCQKFGQICNLSAKIFQI